MAIFMFGRKVIFGQKSVVFLNKKKHSKFIKGLIFIFEMGSFLFAQLFPVVARTWLELRRMSQMENLENQPFSFVGLDVL